jgi:hypothetical protein
VFFANFGTAPPPPPPPFVTITYEAGPGGSVAEDPGETGDPDPQPVVELEVATADSTIPGPAVIAIPDEGYKFVRWNDGKTVNPRADFSLKDTAFVAEFEPIPMFRITYLAGSGGSLTTPGAEDPVQSYEFRSYEGEESPGVTAVADEGYEFIGWSDGLKEETRTDIVGTADTAFHALFIELDDDVDPDTTYFTLIYIAGSGGRLVVDGDTVSSLSRRLMEGTEGPLVDVLPDEGYRFLGWDDDNEVIERSDIAAEEDRTFTALFEKLPVSVMTPPRVVQPQDNDEFAIIAPIIIRAGELVAGPNPVTKRSTVNFFRLGRAVSGTLSVFNASGNLVNRISINDNAAGAGVTTRRLVGSWDLTDSRGRAVAEGTYLVRGTVTTQDGTRERVSLKISVR